MHFTTRPDTPTYSSALLTRVEGLLEQAERLAREACSPTEFFDQVLGELGDILEADGVAVWIRRDDTISLLCDSRPEHAADWAPRGVELIGRLEPDRTVIVPPQVGGRLPNATEFARCVACLSLAPALRMALDVRLPAQAQRGENVGEIVASVGAVVADYQRRVTLERWQAALSTRERLAGVCQTMHASLDSRQIAVELVNGGAAALKVDRISVLLAQPSGFRLKAVTAVAELNRRANSPQAIERLVENWRRLNRPLPWTPLSKSSSVDSVTKIGAISQSEEIESVQRFLNETGARHVRIEPLGPIAGSWQDACAAVVFEMFDGEQRGPDSDSMHEFCRHAAVALRNARQWESAGLPGRVRHWLAVARSRRIRTAAIAVVATMTLLVVVPGDFEIETRGQVQPVRRRHIFAPADGIITNLVAGHGGKVSAEDVLLVLRHPELKLEEQRLQGEISTATARLAAVRAARVDQDRRGPASFSPGQLTAEEEELKQSVASSRQLLEIVRQRIAELTVRSPLTGQVVRWDLTHTLESRPVRQGQLLLDVVDPSGPWQLELRIADRDVRHVLHAQATSSEKLPVRFLFRMAPQATYVATLESVNTATDLDTDGELSTLATVPVDSQGIPDLRVGSSVLAKIHCGRRPLGYVWLRELFEFVQTRVLF